MEDIKQNGSNKKFIKGFLLILGLAIYLLGGVQFMSYISLSVIFFILGSLYRKVKVEYQDYKMLKSVQKTMIKLDDYKSLQDENSLLKDKISDLNTTLSGYSCMAGGLVPPDHTRVQQPINRTNLDMLKEIIND